MLSSYRFYLQNIKLEGHGFKRTRRILPLRVQDEIFPRVDLTKIAPLNTPAIPVKPSLLAAAFALC
jgi:hypothetical protein